MSETGTMVDAKIKAMAPWFGGKRTMAPLIVKQLGEHVQYFEPFCGSAAVLFAKKPSRNETINDLHGDLILLARVLQDETAACDLHERLARTLFSEDLLDQAREFLLSTSGEEFLAQDHFCRTGVASEAVDRAYCYFLASWMGRNGTAGTERVSNQIAVRWTEGGGAPATRWQNVVESIPHWHRRLRNVVILRRDAFTMLDRFEDVAETAIYIDPPYHAASRSGITSRSARYQHEFVHDNPLFGDDHQRLAVLLRAYQHARIVVSYYDCPEVRALYPGWTVVNHTRHKQLHSQNGRGSRRKDAPEILLINGPEIKR